MNQGYEGAVQIDGKVYDLQTLTNTVVANKGASPILFYTRIKSTNSPIVIEATLQDSVKFMEFYFAFNMLNTTLSFLEH